MAYAYRYCVVMINLFGTQMWIKFFFVDQVFHIFVFYFAILKLLAWCIRYPLPIYALALRVGVCLFMCSKFYQKQFSKLKSDLRFKTIFWVIFGNFGISIQNSDYKMLNWSGRVNKRIGIQWSRMLFWSMHSYARCNVYMLLPINCI